MLKRLPVPLTSSGDDSRTFLYRSFLVPANSSRTLTLRARQVSGSSTPNCRFCQDQDGARIAVVDDEGARVESGAHGILESFPAPSAVVAHVLAMVRFDTQPLPGGDGLSAAEIVALFTGEEQTALMAFILTPQSDPQIDALRPRAMQLWMTLPFRSARLALDDTDFVQFVGALVTVDILTQLRAGAVLAGQPPA